MARLKANLLLGDWVAVADLNLPEGATVGATALLPNAQARVSLYDWMRAAPPSDTPRAVERWEKYEQLLQQERHAW